MKICLSVVGFSVSDRREKEGEKEIRRIALVEKLFKKIYCFKRLNVNY